MSRVWLLWVLSGCASASAGDVVTVLPAAQIVAVRSAARAASPAERRAALAQAYTASALTQQLRDREASRRRRDGGGVVVDELEMEDVVVLRGGARAATLEVSWRMAGTVSHSGHAHRRHLRARSRWEAVVTPDGWRIAEEQPIEVLPLP